MSTPARDGARRWSGSPGPPDLLATVAGGTFLLLVAALAGPIAPMGIMTALAAAFMLACCLRAPRPGDPPAGRAWPRTPMEAASIAWLVALVVVSACALDPAGSFPRVKKAFMPLLVPLAVFYTRDARHGRRALAVYLAAAGLVAGYGLVDWVLRGASFESRARGLAGHYMTFAGQLLLEIPLALALALTARGRAWRFGALGVAMLSFASLAVTFTRSAWLGLFVACAVILGATRPAGLLVLAGAGVVAWWFAPGVWGARLHSVVDPGSLWNRERVFMWQAGVRMFRDHPLTGVGLQDLHPLYDQYRSPESVERAGHLHNAYVQIAASMGLVGLAAFTWLYASLMRTAWGALGSVRGLAARVRAGGLASGVRLGVTAALAGFLVAGLFEWNFGDEELLYNLYTLVGLAFASRTWEESRT